jgi:hypothetical protein
MGFDAEGGPAHGWIMPDSEGGLNWAEGIPSQPASALLEVPRMEDCRKIFSSQFIGEQAVGSGAVRMSGNIPMIQALNLVFERIEQYVKPL